MATLYRHYRPQTFVELVGQPHITDTLRQAILRERLAHAYLFYGPRGTGKTTTARILAKRVNCKNPQEAEPCLSCTSCTALTENRHMDVIEIDAASNRGIDDIRALRDAVSTAPVLGKYKVYIIDEVHMLTNEAAGALLKTLEEPVKHVLFILATTELHKVLPTILSRCQLFRFRRATDEEMRSRLQHLLKQEHRQAEPAALDFIIARSDGCYRDAESLLGQLLTLHTKKITRDELVEFMGLPPANLVEQFLQALVKGESSPAIAVVDESFASGFDPEQLLKESIRTARDGALALAKEDNELPLFSKEPFAAERLPVIIRTLLQALQDLAYVPQPLIALHLAILTVCTKKGVAPVQQTKHVLLEQQTPVTPTAISPLSVHVAPKIASEPMPEAASISKVSSDAKQPAPELKQVSAQWDELIRRIKEGNPVAATFLRAIEPMSIEGSTVVLRARYALHRNFFKKPENKKLIENNLGDLLSTPITIRCELDESSQSQPVAAQVQQGQNDDLYEAVQEVFGQKEQQGTLKQS